MRTISVKEILEAEVAKVRGEMAKLEAHAMALEARIAAIPEEVKALSEDAWDHIKALFGFPSPYLTPPTPAAPPAAAPVEHVFEGPTSTPPAA